MKYAYNESYDFQRRILTHQMKGFWKKNDASDEKKLGKLYHHPQKSANFLRYPNMAEVLSFGS